MNREMKPSEDRYHAILNSIEDAFAFCELIRNDRGKVVDFRYLEFNVAFEKQRKKTAEQYLGRTALEVHPNLDHWWIESYEIVVDSREPIRTERLLEGHWYEVGIYPFKDDFFSVIFRDITDRKEGEERRRSAACLDAFRVMLMDALRPLSQSREIERVAMRAVGEFMRVSRVFYCCIDRDQGRETFVVSHDYCAPGVLTMVGRYSTAAFGSMVYDAATNDRTLAVSDVRNHAGHTSDERDSLSSLNIRAYITVPLINDSRLVGLLVIHHQSPRPWTKEEITLAEETADRTWFALEAAKERSVFSFTIP